MARHYILPKKYIIYSKLRHNTIFKKKIYIIYLCFFLFVLYLIFCYSLTVTTNILKHKAKIQDINPNLQISRHSGLA